MHTKHHTQKRQQIDDAAPIGYYIEAQRMKAYSEIEKTRRATGALSNALRARWLLAAANKLFFTHTGATFVGVAPKYRISKYSER